MKNKPKAGAVDMNTAAVKQKHRMAAGLKVDGQTLPSAKKASPSMPKKQCC